MATSNMLERIHGGHEGPTNLPLALLQKITNDFSDERLIADGGFARVYKGVVQNGIIVAVKRIHINEYTVDDKVFRREVTSLMKINHQNVVRFLGFCADSHQKSIEDHDSGEMFFAHVNERLICLEFISNGSLSKHITDESRGFEWKIRYQIIIGICKGLRYLHEEKNIIHMDLTPPNILLDGKYMFPKIAGFGLSRPCINSHTTGTLFGTRGYIAPEYRENAETSLKCDIYSLGAIILELLTGSKDGRYKDNILRRWRHRWNKSAKETPLIYQEQVINCIEIGLLCKEMDPTSRPSISEILSKIGEMRSNDTPVGNANESIVKEVYKPSCVDDMLDIEPLELVFASSEHNNMQVLSCSVELSNDTDGCIAFTIEANGPSLASIEPNNIVMTPRSKCCVAITIPRPNVQDLHKELLNHDFIAFSTKVNEGLTYADINKYILDKHKTSHEVDEVHLEAVSEAFQLQRRNLSDEPYSKESSGDEETELKTLEAILGDANAEPQSLSYSFIKSITRNFSEEIGRGGFGVVYMGYLTTGRVAVKKLFASHEFSDKLFLDEINCLIKTNHDNVVRFLGYCCDSHGKLFILERRHEIAEEQKRFLCFEYVSNGNLHGYLRDKFHKDGWKIRYKMIRGICHGLNYLHEKRIIHLDLKPENILLDAHLEPKITDFGISKCFDEGISRVYTENFRGTMGIIAPETIHNREITFKSDMYGLGFIIIKILTGCNEYDISKWHTSLDVAGPQVKICIEIAQKCVAFDQHDRPTIAEIMHKLNDIERL